MSDPRFERATETTTTPGERLRAARLRLRYSQTEAAERAGVARQTWHKYENGTPAILDTWHKLAVAIGADPHEIDERLAPSRKR
jgi:transcriptional regulator with XRE-family HTH domain